MPKKNLNDIFEKIKDKIIENNLSFQEISNNTGIDIQLLEILFDDKVGIIADTSKLIDFFKINLSYREKVFSIYSIYTKGTTIKITRKLKPRCSMYYNKATGKFYDFQIIRPRINKMTESDILTYKSEMKEIVLSKIIL